MKLSELYQKRSDAWERAKKFLDEHSENGVMNADDAATYDKMEAEVVALGEQITRMQRAQEMEDALRQPTSKPVTDRPDAAAHGDKKGTASEQYDANFWRTMRNKNVPFEVRDALQIGTDSEGGYLVPDEFERTLVQGLEENNVFRRLAHRIRTSSGDRNIPLVSGHGSAQWIDEEGAYNESDDTFGQATLSAYKVGTLIKVSDELLADSAFNLPQYIAAEFARRIGAAEEEAFITGNGTKKPTGFTTNAQVGVTAASATAITSDELIDLYHALKVPYRKNAVWLLNDSTVKLIRKLKLVATGDYLWQPGLVAGQPDRILGRPVVVCAAMPALAAGAAAIAFGDFSYYWIADREGRRIRRLNELYATTGQVGFMASERVDGKLILPEAVQVLKGRAS